MFGLDVFLSIHFVIISCVSKAIKIVDEFILLGVWISEKFLKFLIFIWISREYWRKILAAKDFADRRDAFELNEKKKKRKEAFCCSVHPVDEKKKKKMVDATRSPEIYRGTPINRCWSFQLLRSLFYDRSRLANVAPRVRKNSNVTCGTSPRYNTRRRACFCWSKRSINRLDVWINETY